MPGWQNQVIAPDSRSGGLFGHLGSNPSPGVYLLSAMSGFFDDFLFGVELVRFILIN